MNIYGIDALRFGLSLLIFGVIGMIMTVLGGKGPGIVGIVMGVFALPMVLSGMAIINWLVMLAGWSGSGVTILMRFGTYIAFIGSILLVIGSAMVIDQKKAPPPAASPAQ